MRGTVMVLLLAGVSLVVSGRASAQCTKDTDCKGGGVCEHGACAEPSAPPPTVFSDHLQLGAGLLSFDPFGPGVTVQLGYSHQFTSRFAWEAVRGYYKFDIPSGLRKQLERDYGVLPTAFPVMPRFLVESRGVVSLLRPTALGTSGVQIEGVVGFGAGVAVGDPIHLALSFGPSAALRVGWGDRASLKLEVLDHFLLLAAGLLGLPQFQLSFVLGLGVDAAGG